jgi:hypothetical protein
MYRCPRRVKVPLYGQVSVIGTFGAHFGRESLIRLGNPSRTAARFLFLVRANQGRHVPREDGPTV